MNEPHQHQEPVEQPRDSDWLLEHFVLLAEVSAVRIGVTLSVGGMLVSGTIAPGKAYFADMVRTFRASEPDVEFWQKTVVGSIEELGKVYDHAEHLTDQPLPPARFVHLDGARCFTTSGAPISSTGAWWRGRLAEVKGFSLGILEPAAK